MNTEHKELAEKVINVFKESEKDTLYFPDALAHLFLNENTAKLIINNLTELGLLKLINKGFFRITNKGLNFKGFADLEHKASIENRKSVLDLRLKEWQVKTFWPVFVFALLGSGLSIYNFFDNLFPKDIEQQERIEKMESELEKLKNSILTQNNIDSLKTITVLNNKKIQKYKDLIDK